MKTRLTKQTVLDFLNAGMSREILQEHHDTIQAENAHVLRAVSLLSLGYGIVMLLVSYTNPMFGGQLPFHLMWVLSSLVIAVFTPTHRTNYKDTVEQFAAALRAQLPGVRLGQVHSGLHFLLTLPGAGGERAMVQAAAREGVRLRGLSDYYMERPERCRPDTVVAGYAGLRPEQIAPVAAALARAWLPPR